MVEWLYAVDQTLVNECSCTEYFDDAYQNVCRAYVLLFENNKRVKAKYPFIGTVLLPEFHWRIPAAIHYDIRSDSMSVRSILECHQYEFYYSRCQAD